MKKVEFRMECLQDKIRDLQEEGDKVKEEKDAEIKSLKKTMDYLKTNSEEADSKYTNYSVLSSLVY